LTKPITVSETLEITKSFSIGVSSPGFEYDCFHSMDIAAETEKQKSKKYSINKYYIATSDPTRELLTKKLIIDALPQAISQHKIQVYYQPQYDIITHKLIGFEALSRWYDETLGNITPDVFVTITEEIGLHFEFDLWVFEKVCRQIVEWQKKAMLVPRIAINISFKTMEMSSFIERIKVIVDKTGCPTNLLELEVTETSSITNATMLSANMLQIKSLGMYIAIDDFGTGYSSLSLIRSFSLSIDKLKLDRSLIDKVCHTQLDRNFVKHIIELGKILNVAVLAEGVETQQQLDLLTELGCDYVQGYYFSKALPNEEIVPLIQKTSGIE
jgi:EAL domain-containing protein (putative c-di-GMP-specific phosphodiesterase class I)